MKKTYSITVKVHHFESDFLSLVNRDWEFTVTVTAFSKKEALRMAHDTARQQAAEEWGTSHGHWKTTILRVWDLTHLKAI